MQKKVRPKKQLIRSTQQKATQIQKALTWAKSNKKKQ